MAAVGTSYWPADTTLAVRDMTVGDLLREAAAAAPDRVALVEFGPDPAARRRWTYAELLPDAERVARALLARFEPGERLAVWSPNSAEWVLLEFGAALAGVCLVTVNPAYRAQELRYVLAQSRSSGIIHLSEFRGTPMAALVAEVQPDLPELREVIRLEDWDELLASARPDTPLPEVDPSSPAQIQYTSGTTGFSKGALLHHRGLVNNARFWCHHNRQPDGTVYVNTMPLFHTGGCVLGALGAAACRGTQVLVAPAFDPALLLDAVETERGTHMVGVPTMLVACMERPDFAQRDLSSLVHIVSGGAQVPPELVKQFESALGCTFGIVYGQTEASPVITLTHPDDSLDDKANTVGQPIPQTEVKIVDGTTGETVPHGVVGELCTRGYLVMNGYFDMAEKTAETIDADGWLHTGDLASMDERGYVRIEGRLRDMIIRGGENIYPSEIESVLFEHPAVAEVAVCGIPDPKWGEQVGAFVRLAEGRNATEAELFDWVRGRLAPHKSPRVWQFVDAFPLTPSGKIQKFVLVEEYEAARPG